MADLCGACGEGVSAFRHVMDRAKQREWLRIGASDEGWHAFVYVPRGGFTFNG